jgi:hypothetical protein
MRRPGEPVVAGIAVRCPAVVCLQTMRGDLEDAIEAVEECLGMFPAAPWSIEVNNARRVRAAPTAVIPGQSPEIASLGFALAWVQHRRRGLVCYPAGDCGAICREGMNSFVDPDLAPKTRTRG